MPQHQNSSGGADSMQSASGDDAALRDGGTLESLLTEGGMQVRSLFGAMTEGVAVHEILFDASGNAVDYRIVDVNPAFEAQTGIPANQACGRGARDAYGTSEAPFLDLYWEVARTGEPRTFETYYEPLKRQFSISAFSPKRNWFITLFSDITERSRFDAEIRRLNRIYAVLSQVNQAVVRVHSREELFAQVCEIAIEFGSFALAWIGWVDPKTCEVVPVAAAGAVDYLKGVQIYCDERPEGRGPTGTAIRSGCTYVCGDFSSDPSTLPWRQAAARFNLAAAIALPIAEGGEIRGAFTVYAREIGFFQNKEVKLLEEVAGDISFALDHLAQESRRRRAEQAQAQSLSLLRATLESTADGILVVDLEGHIVDFNEQFVRMWRFPQDAAFLARRNGGVIEGSGHEAMAHVLESLSDPNAFMARVHDLYATPEESAFDILHFKDGRVFERYSIPRRVDGRPVGRVWSFSDVTERVRAEESLRKSELKHRQLIDHLHCGVVVHGPDTRILLSNPEASRLLGLSADQMAGKVAVDPAWSFVHEDGTRMRVEDYPVNRVLAAGQALNGYVVGIDWGLGVPSAWVFVNAYPEFDEGGVLSQIIVTFVDVTERKRSEDALEQSEKKFRSLFAMSLDAIVLADGDRFVDCNEAALQVFGCMLKEEFVGRQLGDFSPPVQPDGRDSRVAARQRIDAAHASGRQFFEWTCQRVDGTMFPAEVLAGRFEIDGRPANQIVIRDISRRKATERRLRQLSRAVEQSPIVVMITDTAGRLEYVNPKFTAVTGYSYEEVIGKKSNMLKSGLTAPHVYAELWQTIQAGKEWRGELHNKKKNGELFWEAASICPITDQSGAITHFLAVKEDVTERKLMNERFLRTQRMESIGSLAGGVAHDLNNILAPIMMSSSMLNDDLPAAVRRQFIVTIQEATQRGADIVRQLLTFARGVEGQRTAFEPTLLLSQLERMVRETFPKSIAFINASCDSPWTITGDLTQLYQVLLNLCVNARDAMPEGGVLTVSVQNCKVDESYLSPEAKPGCYIRFDVTDSGAGIPREILDKVFDPFFTTKEPGKGTGLGLSTALGIVRSHSGFMLVQTAVGGGSTFQVFLPATPDLPPAPAEAAVPVPPDGQGELILIVDDEVEILKVLQSLLVRCNYQVLTARNGAEALAVYQANAATVALVLTDLMMPVMDGVQLARALKKSNPFVKIVATSGHGEDVHQNELRPLGVEVFLKKPFTTTQVLAAIHDILHPARKE